MWYIQDALQQHNQLGKDRGGDEPGRRGEQENLAYDYRHTGQIQLVKMRFSATVFADCEADDEQRDEFRNDHGGEHLHAHRLPEPPLVNENLCDNAET